MKQFRLSRGPAIHLCLCPSPCLLLALITPLPSKPRRALGLKLARYPCATEQLQPARHPILGKCSNLLENEL